jgi:GNAT superfamily N-acetyltransferase
MKLQYEPRIPRRREGNFLQTIRLISKNKPIGHATWQTTAAGIIQLIDIQIAPAHQRQGHGTALLEAVLTQANRYFKLRKMWAPVAQKSQLTARAFFTSKGFHHISSSSDLLRDEDLLVYVKSWV